jgi:IS4 transposase
VVTVETLSRWREDFIAAGIAGLKGKSLDDVRIASLEKKIGQQAMLLELHEKKDQFMRTRSGRSLK